MKNSKSRPSSDKGKHAGQLAHQEVRCAVRFPLMLSATVTTNTWERSAVTRNVSANGILFELEDPTSELQDPMNVGEDIGFSLRMPGEVLGGGRDVLVHCRGRVVRCSISQSHYQAAATIDDYRFAEQ
jgi:hypothetical protein